MADVNVSCLSVPQIPDLEEEPREADLTAAVAEAPNVRSNRVQALQELDQQILFQLPSAMVRERARGTTAHGSERCSRVIELTRVI